MMHTNGYTYKIIKCGDSMGKKGEQKAKKLQTNIVKVQLITRKSKTNARQPKERETDRDGERNGT